LLIPFFERRRLTAGAGSSQLGITDNRARPAGMPAGALWMERRLWMNSGGRGEPSG